MDEHWAYTWDPSDPPGTRPENVGPWLASARAEIRNKFTQYSRRFSLKVRVLEYLCSHLTDTTGVNTDVATSSLLVIVAYTLWGDMNAAHMGDIVRLFFLKGVLTDREATFITLLSFLKNVEPLTTNAFPVLSIWGLFKL